MSKKKKIILIIIAAIFVLGAIGSLSDNDDTSLDGSSTSQQQSKNENKDQDSSKENEAEKSKKEQEKQAKAEKKKQEKEAKAEKKEQEKKAKADKKEQKKKAKADKKTAKKAAKKLKETKKQLKRKYDLTGGSPVQNDKTGNWKVETIHNSDANDPTKWALDYYNVYWDKNNKDSTQVLGVVNFSNNTTTAIVDYGEFIKVTQHEYIKGEEHDAAELFGGMVLQEYNINIKSGKVEKI